MFDRSLLRPAEFEFIVLADTHYMCQPGSEPAEFKSRLKQTQRAELALQLAAALECPLVIHMGDLVQAYPDMESFPRALSEALGQLERCKIRPRFVAGNHDVGDKPDPTMPTRPVTRESLSAYHAVCGNSWYSFDQGGCHFVVLNSQIFNTDLPETVRQRRWLERDLAQHEGKRTYLFLHLPPYLCDRAEPSLGHYDNLADPDRSWLLDQLQGRVEMLVAAHVHCAFADRIDRTRYVICNSTSFTRPGFPHMFTGAAPPDRGRDDADKLGFYLFRVFVKRTDVHFIRTHGAERLAEWLSRGDADNSSSSGTAELISCSLGADPRANQPARRVITRTAATSSASPLGVTLRHPLCSLIDIPLAWPSAIRQRVRNDYPLLHCLELGAAAVRVPAADFSDPLQTERLAMLRAEGTQLVATVLWQDRSQVDPLIRRHAEQVDTWELQLAGSRWPSNDQLRQLREYRHRGIAVSLSTVIPNERIAGKQHPRTRIGFQPTELPQLEERLATAGVAVDRTLCRLSADPQLWRAVVDAPLPATEVIGGIDWACELPGVDDAENALVAARALLAVCSRGDSRLFVEPFVDLDRTMDVGHGLIDTCCNPRSAFYALGVLSSVWAAELDWVAAAGSFSAGTADDTDVISLVYSSTTKILLLPGATAAASSGDLRQQLKQCLAGSQQVQAFDLQRATVEQLTTATAADWAINVAPRSGGPLLFVAKS